MAEELKPFDRVLVRQSPYDIWEVGIFGRESIEEPTYRCAGKYYRYCIPYEGNEYLLGTAGEPKQEFKFGDHVEVRDYINESWYEAIYIYYRKNSSFPYVVIRAGNIETTSYVYCRHANW